MAATTGQPNTETNQNAIQTSHDQESQDLIGQSTGHVTTGAVRFKESQEGSKVEGDNSSTKVNGEQAARPKNKRLTRKNTPACLPNVQKLNSKYLIQYPGKLTTMPCILLGRS